MLLPRHSLDKKIPTHLAKPLLSEKEIMKTKKGMTLIELLLILTLLGILTSISFGSLTGLRQNANVRSDLKQTASLLQEAKSTAEHSALRTIGNEECAMSEYYVVWDTTASPVEIQFLGTPESDCSTTTPQVIRERTLRPGITIETVPYNLTRITYEVPDGNVGFQPALNASGNPVSEVSLTLQMEDGRFSRTITIDALRGYPESPL